MSLIFQAELDKLASQGVALHDMTPGEVEALVHACDRMASPFSDVNADAVGIPIRAGGVYFWRLTIGATLWLDEYARRWWDDKPRRYEWALVYASIHARDKGAFSALTDEAVAEEAVKKQALELVVNSEEVIEALYRVLGISGDPDMEERRGPPRPTPQTNWAEVLARLESQSGIPNAVWAWERSSDYALKCYVDMTHFAAATGGARLPRMKDERDRATTALARLTARIVARVRADRAAKEESAE